MNQTVLFHGVVGSHAWGANHARSDLDLFEVYIASTFDIFTGKRMKTKFKAALEAYEAGHIKHLPQASKIDVTRMEIGHLVGLLKKGTINAIHAVLSPLAVELEFEALSTLKGIVENSLSTKTWHSVKGLATNKLKYIHAERYKPGFQEKRKKALGTCGRMILQYDELLDTGRLNFNQPGGDWDAEEIEGLIEYIDDRIEEGNHVLKDSIDVDAFDWYLFYLRRKKYEQDILEDEEREIYVLV